MHRFYLIKKQRKFGPLANYMHNSANIWQKFCMISYNISWDNTTIIHSKPYPSTNNGMLLQYTGWFKANLYTLTNNYGKLSVCTEKIMVDLFSVYPDISFDNNKSEKIT